MLLVRWPVRARCRAFLAHISADIARLDAYSSMGNNDDANLVTVLGPEAAPLVLTLLPDRSFADLECIFGAGVQDLRELLSLPFHGASGDLILEAQETHYARVFYDKATPLVLWSFSSDNAPSRFAGAIRTCQGTVWLLFDESARWSGILFMDVIFDDTVSGIEAWQAEHGWAVDAR